MNHTISTKTKLTGLIGHPVTQSLSHKMHNAAFQYLNLDYMYFPFDIQEKDLPNTVLGLKALGFKGFNVTMPFKQTIMQYLDEISKEAQLIGSVNTIVNCDGYFVGHNTDGKGFIQALKDENLDVGNKVFVLAGAGGAARSIAVQLALEGVEELIILNRTIEAANRIAEVIRKNISSCKIKTDDLSDKSLRKYVNGADVFVNCTPIGMFSSQDKSVIEDSSILRSDLAVCDLIYKPQQTRLLQIAEDKGCKTINGLGMLLWQGAFAFELWTGVPMPVSYIKEILFQIK